MNALKPKRNCWWFHVGRPAVVVAAAAAAALSAACNVKVPSMEQLQESKLFDRRIKETPREATTRRCRLESDRFRVGCKYCHDQPAPAQLSADEPHLTKEGLRARVMRNNPTFGLHRACTDCHLSKFRLNAAARADFTPDGRGFDVTPKP
jgi:hypothetical protein